MKTMKNVVLLLMVCFAFESFAQVVESTPPRDNFYEKENTQGRKPRPFVYVREADVYMKQRVWRMVDFREKMNQYFYYPIQPVQDRVSLMTMITEGIQNGTIVAYDALTDDFRKPMTYEEFTAQNTKIEEKEVEDLDNPGQMVTRTDTSSFKTENVKMLRIKEDWFVDRQRGIRDIRILGLCPVQQVFDDASGELKGTQSMFWLYYDNCRDLFASTESFNRHNSAQRLSYDDVFAWKRFFNSYITKKDNQQDRQINEYATGTQIMLEAERMKEELFNLEHDLWEY